MTGRVVLEVGFHTDGDQKTVTVRVEEPFELADAGSAPLPLSVTDRPFLDFENQNGDAPCRAAGEAIYNGLANVPAVSGALDEIKNVGDAGSIEVLLRIVPSNPADDLPWETLYLPDSDRFAGLDPRWPLARIAGHSAIEAHHLTVADRFRVVAVLAAADRFALPEWEAIHQAATDNGLDCEVHVLCSETAVKDAVDLAAEGNPHLSASYIDSTNPELLVAAINRHRPNLLHVFAHGSAQHGFLEVATHNVEIGDAEALVHLDASQFTRASAHAWFAVLNVCELAGGTASGRSFVYAVVNNGTPAAVGMRREIDVTDAHSFSRAFYGEAFERLAASLQADGTSEIDWAGIVRIARTALIPAGGTIDAMAGGHNEWTLPVLYVRAGEFTLERMMPAGDDMTDDDRQKFTELLTLERMVMGRELTAEFRHMVDARIAQLRADLGVP